MLGKNQKLWTKNQIVWTRNQNHWLKITFPGPEIKYNCMNDEYMIIKINV